MGIGKAADFVTRATDSPEAYQFRKDAIRANPFLFDETSTDEFIKFSEELAEKQKEGEAPGFSWHRFHKFTRCIYSVAQLCEGGEVTGSDNTSRLDRGTMRPR